MAQMPSSVNDSGIFSFPQGKRLARFAMTANELKLTGNPNYVIVKPLVDAKMGIFDLTKGTLVSGMNKNDATFWNDLIIYELISGSVTISQTKYDEATKILQSTKIGTIDIPVGAMNQLSAANVSDNMQWLAARPHHETRLKPRLKFEHRTSVV